MTGRLLKIRNELKKHNPDGLLISSVPNIIYLTGYSNFSYFEREAYLFITKDAAYIITDGRYSEAVSRQVSHFTLLEITSDNPLEHILTSLAEKHKVRKLGVEEENLTLSEYKLLLKYYPKIYHLENAAGALRAIKNTGEIRLIKKACRLGDETFSYILTKIKKGVSEKQLAFEIEMFIKKNGGDISFSPIAAFGKNSAVPHHQTGNQRLTPNSIVLLDFGVKFNNYCSDMTRTVFFGKAAGEQKRMYQTVLGAQQKAIEHLERITSDGGRVSLRSHDSSEVDKIARDYILSKNYPAIPHSLGHGIGIEVHESPHLSPKSKDILKPGMVFSIEPGIYLPGKFGVRIEDLAVIRNNRLEIITRSPKQLIEL